MPKIWGFEHFTYLAVFTVICIIATILILKFVKTEKMLTITMKIIGGILFACILWNRISICVKNNNAIHLIPESFCGISSLVLSLSLIIGKKDNMFFHFICYLGFVGGFLTSIYPDFIEQSPIFFYSPTISGLLHHTIMLYAVILMLITKYFVPTFKKWYILPLGLCGIMTLGIFEITALGFNDAMQIFNPVLPDTIFTWWFMGILMFIFAYSVMLIFDYFNIYRKKKKVKEESEV